MENDVMKALRELISAQSVDKTGQPIMPRAAIGRQLLDLAGRDSAAAELLLRDLDVEEMNLAAAEKLLQKYADDNHKKAKCFCITPDVAERLLRDFYKLPDPAGEDRAEAERDAALTAAKTAEQAELAARNRVTELQKEIRMASPLIAEFRAGFETLQDAAARLQDLIVRLRETDQDTADKLSAAISAFAEQLKKAV